MISPVLYVKIPLNHLLISMYQNFSISKPNYVNDIEQLPF